MYAYVADSILRHLSFFHISYSKDCLIRLPHKFFTFSPFFWLLNIVSLCYNVNFVKYSVMLDNLLETYTFFHFMLMSLCLNISTSPLQIIHYKFIRYQGLLWQQTFFVPNNVVWFRGNFPKQRSTIAMQLSKTRKYIK